MRALAVISPIPYVCSLEAAMDKRQVGGKAWNLCRMMGLGIRVPPGFVVTDRSFQEFLEKNRLKNRLEKIRKNIEPRNPTSLKMAAEAIRKLTRLSSVPQVVRDALQLWVLRLDSPWPLIVRSSAVGEDSRHASFAGQLDSFPDIKTLEGLEKALRDCWMSCWSERALLYQHSIGTRIERMGVVIQLQVQPRAAGVLFTIAPGGSGESTEMLGEYCVGFGEDLVSGKINPGRFTISRKEFRFQILEHPHDPEKGEIAKGLLDENNFRSLRGIGLSLERELKGPQDIEWAIDDDGCVQIVQSRPVTVVEKSTETPHPRSAKKEVPITVWSNANINENYPDPVSPFLYSVAAEGYYYYFRNLAHAVGISKSRIRAMDYFLRNIIGVHGARMYYNLTNIHATLRMAPFGDRLAEYFNVFVGVEEKTSSPKQAETFADRRKGHLIQKGELLWIVAKSALEFLFLEKRVATFERMVSEYARATHPDMLTQKSLVDLQSALRSFLDIRFHRWKNASLADAASMIGYGTLKSLSGRAFCRKEYSTFHNRLLQGLPGLVSGQPVIELWKLSRRVKADRALKYLFANGKDEEILEKLRKNTRQKGFLRDFDHFLEKWGFRISGELMLTVKSLQEEPEGAISMLKGYIALEGESPVELLAQRAKERIGETKRFLGALRQRRFLRVLPWPTEATVARIVLKWTQSAIALRERARLKQSLLYSRCRRVLLRIGEELSIQGVLKEREDVFFLDYHELDGIISGTSQLLDGVRALVEFRRVEQRRLGAMELQETLTLPEGATASSHTCKKDDLSIEDRVHDAMLGIGACGGKATGTARVLTDISQSSSLSAGDVLVTRQTDPGWAPVFFMVSALVMERGGMLSHGAIIAREYGIPTVVGVTKATQRIQTGRMLEVNGDKGSVQIVG